MAIPAKKTKAAPQGVQFWDDSFYQSGFALAEGEWWWKEVEFVNHSGFGEKKFDNATLGVMVTLVSLDGQRKENKQFYSMGSSAIKSFGPHPDDPHMLIALPDAKGTQITTTSHWGMLRESLMNAGFPAELMAQATLAPLVGLWAYMKNEPEPQDLADFRNKRRNEGATGEAAMARAVEGSEKRATPRNVAVVSGFLENGKPWEDGGGEPAEEVEAPKAASKPNGKVASKPAPEPEPEEEEEAEDEDLQTTAMNAITKVLTSAAKKNVTLTRVALRTETFKAGGDNGQAILDTYFKDEATLKKLLGVLEHTIKGTGPTATIVAA